MHESVMAYAEEMLLHLLPDANVLEVGSYDVNGNLRSLCLKGGVRSYVGTDMRAGPGVDVVCAAEDLTNLPAAGPGAFDIVASTEMLEHAKDWRGALWGMTQVLRYGGHLLLTCRGIGAGYHAHPEDWWRFSVEDVTASLYCLGMLPLDVREDTGDHGVLAFARRTNTRPRPELMPEAFPMPQPPTLDEGPDTV